MPRPYPGSIPWPALPANLWRCPASQRAPNPAPGSIAVDWPTVAFAPGADLALIAAYGDGVIMLQLLDGSIDCAGALLAADAHDLPHLADVKCAVFIKELPKPLCPPEYSHMPDTSLQPRDLSSASQMHALSDSRYSEYGF